MDIYLVVNGWYDDTVVVGVATSLEAAQAMVTKAQVEHPGEFLTGFDIDGPFKPGQLRDRLGNAL